MWWTKIFSSVAGAWLPLAIVFALVAGFMAVYGVGRSHGRTAADAVWAERVEDARVAAAQVTARQNERLLAANGALKDEQTKVAALDYALAGTVGRLREYAARPRNLPQPADYPRCVAELGAERDRAEALGQLLVRGSDLARTLAAERDDAVARLWAASDAWPR